LKKVSLFIELSNISPSKFNKRNEFPGVHSFPNNDELIHYFELHRTNRDFAIIFENNEPNDKDIPTILNYTIRTRNNNFRTGEIYVNNVFDVAMKEIDEYIDSGFLALQRSLDQSFLEMVGVDVASYEVCWN